MIDASTLLSDFQQEFLGFPFMHCKHAILRLEVIWSLMYYIG